MSAALFQELKNATDEEDHEKVLSICEQILEKDPKDKEALHSKVIALIHSSKFDQALRILDNNAELSQDLSFERAYCLYRTNMFEKALQSLENAPNTESKLWLQAQVYYKMEKFQEAAEIILGNSTQSRNSEFLTNKIAILLSSRNLKEASRTVASNKRTLQESYELLHNAGLVAVAEGNLEQAEKFLQQSLKKCEEDHKAENASKEEIEDETALIRSALAYLHHLQSNDDKATEELRSIIDKKVSDKGVYAVASNNFVALQEGSKNIREHVKTMKSISNVEAESKLLGSQKLVIASNRVLLLLKTDQVAEAKQMLDAYKKDFGEDENLAILEAAILKKEKKEDEAEKFLKDYVSKNPGAVSIHLLLAQSSYRKGHFDTTINSLESVEQLKNNPDIVDVLVHMYEQKKNIQKACQVLDDFAESKKNDEEEYTKALKKSGNFKLKHKMFQEAARSFEKVLDSNPNDIEALPAFVICCSEFDPNLSEKYSSRIAHLIEEEEEEEVDIDALESLPLPKAEDEETHPEQKETKKKKKKKKLPKNYNPNKEPDPERWLPLKERSYFRKKRKGKMEKGAQGLASAPLGQAILSKDKKQGEQAEKASESKQQQQQSQTQSKPKTATKKKKKGKKKQLQLDALPLK